MRKKDHAGDLKLLGIAGTHVVLLGWDLDRKKLEAASVIGFAVQRTRKSDGEVIWMSGMKTLEAVEPDPPQGVPVSTHRHPVQAFQWADYSVDVEQEYTYKVVARCNTQNDLRKLTDGPSATVTVRTESVDQGKHAVFFNRGAVASQEYARRFLNKTPKELGKPAYDWLSRGLIEGLVAFIGQAGKADELYGAFFEFKAPIVFDALVAAVKRGAVVRVRYDGDSEREANEAAFGNHEIAKLADLKPRTRSGSFAHNKFFVLVKNGKPAQLWTGSTNLSENGIYGHSNNAHIVRIGEIAAQYLKYWKIIDEDVTLKKTAAKADALVQVPPPKFSDGTMAVFSPRQEADALTWYAQLAGEASGAMFATFAFGIDEQFIAVYDRDKDDVLRFALLEKKGNGSNYQKQAAQVDAVRKRLNTVVAVGNNISLNNFDRWLDEIDRMQSAVNVRFIHTKYMLVDPLGKDPKIVIGSANFSNASSVTNDENMLVIKGDDKLADIYLGEFMRLHAHYAFREAVSFVHKPTTADVWARKFLRPDTSWIDGEPGKVTTTGYYAKGNDRYLRRRYFSGQA